MSQDGPRQVVAGVALGEVVAGKYRVERVLGVGGVGTVVAAHHIHLDETVALKFLRPEALESADVVARFVREAQAAVKMRSEHVARVIDVSTLPNGAPYIVMEYLEGGDLAHWVKERGPLPVSQGVDFILQAIVAVADAHALGIVHRDLKPANLFCVRRSDGQLSIKVLDFGISKITGRKGSLAGNLTGHGQGVTQTSSLMGSPHYMSPEQMRSSKDVDAHTDIWALGVTLFELLTGRVPFQADSLTQLAIQVANEPAPSMRSLQPDVPPGLEAVVATCLKKDPRERYPNVAELALALQPFAPARAKASVERILGIIHAAGLSMGTRTVPLSPPAAGMPTSAGSVAPLGKTTENDKKRGGLRLPLISASIGLALLGVVISAGRLLGHPEHAAALLADKPSPLPPAASPGGTAGAPEDKPLPSPAAAVDRQELDDVRSPEAVPIERLPVAQSSRPAPATLPPAADTFNRSLPPSGQTAPITPSATQPAAPATSVRTPPTPASPPTKCTPPYYFDAKGNRLFKKECV